MSTQHIVTAGYVTVETAVPGGRAWVDIPRGATLPADVPAAEVETLLRLGRITPAEQSAPSRPEPAAPAAPDADPMPTLPSSIPTLLAWVGDDPGRARQLHDAESARSTARSSLLAALSDILDGSE